MRTIVRNFTSIFCAWNKWPYGFPAKPQIGNITAAHVLLWITYYTEKSYKCNSHLLLRMKVILFCRKR